MLEFICAVYNEENEIDDLINHVRDYVDKIHIVDDVSTDSTPQLLQKWWERDQLKYYEPGPIDDTFDWHQMDKHTGLCELVRIEALKMCEDDSWVLMLDADERFPVETLEKIKEFVANPPEDVTHVYFSQREFIDGKNVAQFAKVKLFKKSAAHLPEIIHKDPQFDGEAYNFGGVVIHRKSSSKQVMRELEYLQTYDKLLDEGKVTQSDVDWFKGMHHFVRERHG